MPPPTLRATLSPPPVRALNSRFFLGLPCAVCLTEPGGERHPRPRAPVRGGVGGSPPWQFRGKPFVCHHSSRRGDTSSAGQDPPEKIHLEHFHAGNAARSRVIAAPCQPPGPHARALTVAARRSQASTMVAAFRLNLRRRRCVSLHACRSCWGSSDANLTSTCLPACLSLYLPGTGVQLLDAGDRGGCETGEGGKGVALDADAGEKQGARRI